LSQRSDESWTFSIEPTIYMSYQWSLRFTGGVSSSGERVVRFFLDFAEFGYKRESVVGGLKWRCISVSGRETRQNGFVYVLKK